MLSYRQLVAILPTLPMQTVETICFRAVNLETLFGFHRVPPYATVRPLYPLGAPLRGARFTPVGGMASLYVAADPETAYAEVNQVYNKLRSNSQSVSHPPAPTVIFSVAIKLERYLDLADSSVRTALHTNDRELTGAWRRAVRGSSVTPTQQMGKAAFECGHIQALRYVSAQNLGHVCYVIFTDRLTNSSSYAEVYDPDGNLRERLP
jgi:RES domain-containing protein